MTRLYGDTVLCTRSLWLSIIVVATFGCTADDVPSGRVEIRPSLLKDPGGRYTIADVTASPLATRFEPAPSPHPNLGFESAAVWVRLPLDIPDDEPGRLLELGYAPLDDVRLFWPRSDGAWTKTAVGDRRPFAERPVRHRTFVFPVPPGRGARSAYLRVETEGPMVLPVTLWRGETFRSHAQDEQLILGFYYAFLIALAAYNLFLFALIRDRTYLYYVGYLVGFAFYQASISGHTFMYLWPTRPEWGNVASVTFVLVSLACGLRFTARMTHLATLSPRLDRGVGIFAISCLAVIPLAWMAFGVGVRVAGGLGVMAVFFLPVPIAMALGRYRPARYVALGYAAILPGAVLHGLRTLGFIPCTFWIEHAVQFGTALEALLLSFALADRIALLTRERAEAQALRIDAERHALELQRAFSKGLLDAGDRERKRIAAELHDGIGQNLVVLANRIKRIARKAEPTDLPRACGRLEEIARDTVQELRGVAHALHPHQLDRLGLGAALRQVVEQTLAPAGIDFRSTVADIEHALPREAEIHVYRIVQEALSNVVRHAAASLVVVAVARNGSGLFVTIEDDGCGLNGETGFGLTSMRERARHIGGELLLSSNRPRGVVVQLRVPIEEVP